MGSHDFFGQLPEWTFVDVAGAYTAKPGEYVLVDASAGPITITLSTGTSGVKKIDASSNLVTIQAAAGNTLGSLGATMFPLRLPDQALIATVRGTNHAITHGYQSLQQLDTRFAPASSSRSVSANTTALANETLWVNASGGARTVVRPTPNPAAGTRVFVGKSDTGPNPVTLAWTINGDTDGVQLADPGAAVTVVWDGAAWSIDSTSTPTTAITSGGGSRVPAAAGARSGFYDVARNLYTPTTAALRALRGHVGRAANGSLVDMVCGGDSRTIGYGIDSKNSWPAQLRGLLASVGLPPAGTGLVMVANNNTSIDSRVVLAGSWTVSLPSQNWTATGATATFSADSPGTVAEVYYGLGSGSFTVSVDGGTAETVAATSGSGFAKWTRTGLSDAVHTVRVTSTSASGVLFGFCLRRTSGLLVHAIGVAGYSTGNWAATGAGTLQALTSYINPSIFDLMISVNDPLAGVSVSSSASNLATILAANSGAARLLTVESAHPTYAAQWPSYVAGQYDRADALDLPVIDLNDRFGTPAQGTAAGLLGADNLHETLAGANSIARSVAELLAA